MEEVLETLNKTKFDGLYKNKDRSLENQDQRRKQMLLLQKTQRTALTDSFRGVLALVEAVEEEGVESNNFKKHKVRYNPEIYVAGFTKYTYKNVLMMSEWMVQKPHDFHENWFVLPCPKGMRTLVVATQGKTKLFSRDGTHVKTYQSLLPGGNKFEGHQNSRCCILDGFYVPATHTIYVLDLLAWNSHLMCDGETEFRHYWILSQLNEMPDLEKHTENNQINFKLIPKVPCDPESFADFMMRIPHFPNFTPKLDGLLFYHKKAHYVSGFTPLVGWLYPFMVPEVFGEDVKVNPLYMEEKPADYVDQADFIANFTIKKKRRQRLNEWMDTADDNDRLVVETLTESGAFDPDDMDEGNEAGALKMQ